MAKTKEARRETAAAGRDAGHDAKDTAKDTGRIITDGWIKSKIYAQFITEDALSDSDINLDVMKGVVTLKGTVRCEAGRSRALAIAKATDGVKGAKDDLRVVSKP